LPRAVKAELLKTPVAVLNAGKLVCRK